MHAEVTVHMKASADEIWQLIADIRNTGRFSPETFEAEWLTSHVTACDQTEMNLTGGDIRLYCFAAN